MKNVLKHRLRGGKLTFGTFVTIGHPDVSEAVGASGLDFAIIDMEHAPISLETAQVLLQAMSYSETSPLLRVGWNDPVMVKRALDIGAQGIVFPWINNREEAVQAVRSTRYPPAGIRGFGPRRAALRDPTYVEDANEEILVTVQIETKEGIRNVDEILSVDGVDVALVGPSDLSLSLGSFGRKGDPRFKEATRKVLKACKKHRVVPSIYSEESEVKKWLDEGFRMLLVESDLMLLSKGLRTLVNTRGSGPT